jgi:two-component system sensor histidine kinase HydH
MQILRSKKLYLPAVTIVAVVLLLLVLMSILTLRNFDREKKIAIKFLHNQGLALMQSLEAGVRTGMMTPLWGVDSTATLIQETAKNNNIAYIYLVDSSGDVVHSSDPGKKGNWLGRQVNLSKEHKVEARIIRPAAGDAVYELAKLFEPVYDVQATPHHRMMLQTNHHSGDVIVLGLKMATVEDARHSDIQHALIMAASLIILGSGALFFIFVIQNYYLVNRTLKQTQDYTRQVVASMANGLLSIDLEGKITSYNTLALDLLGLKAENVKETNLGSLIDFEVCGIPRTLQQREPVLEKEIALKTEEGHTLPLAISVTPILAESGACHGAVIVLRDLREIKRLEEKVRRSEKLAAIGELAAGVAHEIRNPLSSIRGFAQYLKHALKDKPQERVYADTMVSEVDRINTVINDLLSFARPMTLETAATDVAELVRHSKRLVEADAKTRRVAIDEHLGDHLREIHVDANQLKQAILNLLLNALQSVSNGGHIKIGAFVNAGRTELRLWVEDDGPGITPDEQEKIFEPFFTKRDQGTGLGLPIVHKIVENHSGEIQLESPAPGSVRGCRFTLLLPIGESSPDSDDPKRP